MATGRLSGVIRHLGSAALRDAGDRTDAQLLGAFLSHRDQAAFEALMRRHGPMVMGVCLRILPTGHDAEDAFQATFLVLVRKAASIASRELLANWLYGVACNTARRAKASIIRRQKREQQVTEMPEPEAEQHDLWQDLAPVLDQELGRLPDKYRAPIVLCDLEGKTRKEAAQQLGCPEGTVAGRLARARALLAERLARHGITVSGAVLAAVLSQRAASACVPISVVSSASRAAILYAAGQQAAGLVSAQVATLTEGVLKAMFLARLKMTLTILLVVGAVAFGGGLLAQRLPVGQQRPAGQEQAAPLVERAGPAGPTVERPPQLDEVQIQARKLTRVPDPSPELRRELAAFDAYRHGSEEKFGELERKADELLKKYPARDDQARIYGAVAHVAAQSDIRNHVKRVQTYARKSLALSRDPVQRGLMYSYLGSAVEVELEKPFADRRREAATELLLGYVEMLAQELPEKAPELPIIEKLGGEEEQPGPLEIARHAAQVEARLQAEFIRDLVQRRDTLAGQLRWLYHPHPKIHGRNPEGPNELKALATKMLRDRKAVDALLDRVIE
jgi:RNA polymerase sigma factor (sigma-70 family)